jgi:hypothetical protein
MQLQVVERKPAPIRGKSPARTAPLVRENLRSHFEIGGDLESTRRAFDEPSKVDTLAHVVYEMGRELRRLRTRLAIRDGFGAVPTVRESRGLHLVGGRAA